MWALGTLLYFPWLVEHLEPEGIESHAKRIGAGYPLPRHRIVRLLIRNGGVPPARTGPADFRDHYLLSSLAHLLEAVIPGPLHLWIDITGRSSTIPRVDCQVGNRVAFIDDRQPFRVWVLQYGPAEAGCHPRRDGRIAWHFCFGVLHGCSDEVRLIDAHILAVHFVTDHQIERETGPILVAGRLRLTQGLVDLSLRRRQIIGSHPDSERKGQLIFCSLVHVPLIASIHSVGADVGELAGDDLHVSIDTRLGDPAGRKGIGPMVRGIADAKKCHDLPQYAVDEAE